MGSTSDSEVMVSVQNLEIFYSLDHYEQQGFRDLFVSVLSDPLDYLLKQKEILPVINGISFELRRGTRLGIIGANGSGKTSLCRAIAGMIKGQKGTVSSPYNVRAIFDTGTGVIPELTGRENAYLLSRFFFPETRDLTSVVEEAIEFSELGHFIDVPLYKYSKGMQARLVLSLISSVPPEVLILDEVLDGADIFFQRKIAGRMRSLIDASGATIFVSHSLEQLEGVCTEVLVLDKGKIFFRGPVKDAWAAFEKLRS